jgi:hypothetical protein
VPKDVAETGDCPRGDVLVLSPEYRRNVTRRLGNPLEVALHRIACHPIGGVVFEGLAGGQCFNPGNGVEDVSEAV